jgi:hypothetical protein
LEQTMKLIQWKKEYSVSVPELDEYKGLVMLIN